MSQSHVVEVSGTFVGAAITTSAGFRFRAVHIQVEELDDSAWLSLDELKRAVRHLFTTGRLIPAADMAGAAASRVASPKVAPSRADVRFAS